MAESWIRDAAQEFWVSARKSGPFPRDLEGAIAWVLPLGILRIPNLWVSDVEAALLQRQLLFTANAKNRPLHGCVCAYAGKGLIIVDATDDASELRFTVAHELAHFLLDYQTPRMQAIDRLGQEITSVLDGLRSPTAGERADALLANVPIGLYAHFMHRDGAGAAETAIAQSETRADALALELLSPEMEVRRSLPRGFLDKPFAKRIKSVRRVLVRRFGLPRHIALPQAARLCRSWFGGPSIREWLGFV